MQPRPATPSPPGASIFQGVGAPGAAAVYQGLRAQRRELTNQLDELESTRENITSDLEQLPSTSPQRKVLEDRLGEVDKGIATVDQMLVTNSAQLSQAAAIPGAVVEPTRVIQQGPPEEAYIILGGLFMLIVLLPLSIALARRIWRRGATAVAAFPRDLADRLTRMEQALEATAIEVERIGEGQRFLTRLFTEGEGARAIGSGAVGGTRLLERKQGTPERLP